MKKTIATILLALAMSPVVAFSQGQVQFDSIGFSFPPSTTSGRVFNTDGTTPLSGSGFTAQLWGGLSNDRNTFSMLATQVGFETGGDAGRIFKAEAVTTGFAGGSTLFYEIRAWDNGAGSITTYDSATIRNNSGINTVLLTVAPSTPNPTDNFSNFNLAVVPEPTTVVFGVMGAGALLMRRRK